jgi:hypothetical protein
MKSIAALILIILSFHAGAKIVDHKVQGNETAWFLAQLYFGTGARYPEILKTNSFNSTDAIKPGGIVKIENPLYDPTQKNFQERLQQLKKKRETDLGTASAKSVHPSAGILPFMKVKESQKSAQQRAKEEIEPRSSSTEGE